MPPYGALIEEARKKARLSMREAGRRAGISGNWWRYVTEGHQGETPVPGTAETVAAMARVVGVTPEQLAGKGQRPDAAEALREMLRPVTAENRPPPLPEPPTAAEEAVERFPGDLVAQAIWRQPNTPEAERWEMIATLERKRREIQSRKSQAG